MSNVVDFSDVQSSLGVNMDGLFIKREQVVPDEFLKHLADDRFDSLKKPAGDMHRVCSIPVAIVEKWLHEGFDIHRENIHAIIARLKKEGLDGLMATNKRI